MAQALQADFLLSGVLNQSGQPNSGGWAIFYEADGSTLKSVFADSEKIATKTLNSNNGVDLDLNGSATVFLDGTYTVKIYDKNGVLLRTFSSLQFNPQDASSADYIEAKNYGSSNDGTRISLAVSDAAGADRTVYLAPANYAITSDLTIPSNINLKFEMGAFLTVSSGITVTINGSIEAPLYNIFRGSGTTTFDDRNNVVPSVWSSGTHDNLTLDGVVNVSDTLQLGGVSVTSTAAELNILDGVTASTSELNILDGVTATTSELNIMDGVTATTSELNIMDGVTSTTSELNLLDGSASGTIVNSKGVVYGSAGEVNMTSLEIAGLRSVPNLNVEKGYVYLSGAGNFECSQSATPGQSVQVDDRSSSTFYGSDGAAYVSSNASVVTVSLTSSDASNPRWDLVELDASAGTYGVVDGTASANPTYPTGTAGKDAIAYVYRKASTAGNTIYDRDILDARVSIKNKTVDGHFKTNFSINQKEDTEQTFFDNQQFFQKIPYETTFDYVQEDKTNLQYIDTIMVPADSVNGEVVYTGTWGTPDSSSYFFGRAKTSSTTSSGTATLSFTGVSCNVIFYETSNSAATFKAELSSDGGATWHSEIIKAVNYISGAEDNSTHELYQGLPYGDYQVRITNLIAGSTYITIEAFSYATYLVQTLATQKALLSQSPTDIDDVPPLTTLFGGAWTINQTTTSSWGGVYNATTNNSATVEYKFYGSSIYLNTYFNSSYDATYSVTIDGSTTYVKNASITNPSYAANQSVWVRLDNGLPEGVHTVKITTTSAASGESFIVNGWAHYSSKHPTTCSRSLICGKNSYAVGIDDSAVTLTGSFSSVHSSNSFLGRRADTSTAGDNLTITTPTNCKAIYLITYDETDQGEVKITLGGSNTRYINIDTDNVHQGSNIKLLYDAYIDGISLDSLTLQIQKNASTGGTNMRIEGVIFEVGDAVELDSVFCMPKWTRYNASSNNKTPVSTSHRLDVYGSKSDGSTGRQPMVHSGFVYHSSGSYVHYRHGLNMQDMNYKYERGGPEAKVYHLDAGANNDLYNFYGDFGLISTGSYATNEWVRISLFPNRVI